MSKYISELMSPQLMGVIYAFVGFIIALYVLSVVYVFIDARRRGASAYVAWGIIASSRLWASSLPGPAPALLRGRPRGAGAGYGPARAPACPVWHLPQCGAPIEKDFVVCPVCDTQVRNVCPSCHRPLDAHWKVCPYCRTRIQ